MSEKSIILFLLIFLVKTIAVLTVSKINAQTYFNTAYENDIFDFFLHLLMFDNNFEFKLIGTMEHQIQIITLRKRGIAATNDVRHRRMKIQFIITFTTRK